MLRIRRVKGTWGDAHVAQQASAHLPATPLSGYPVCNAAGTPTLLTIGGLHAI
ncbi:MAG: hypothetical protein U0821_26835 [Chloroflexota bacterium]